MLGFCLLRPCATRRRKSARAELVSLENWIVFAAIGLSLECFTTPDRFFVRRAYSARRRNFGGLCEGLRGWSKSVARSRHEAGADVAQHRLGVLRGRRSLLEGDLLRISPSLAIFNFSSFPARCAAALPQAVVCNARLTLPSSVRCYHLGDGVARGVARASRGGGLRRGFGFGWRKRNRPRGAAPKFGLSFEQQTPAALSSAVFWDYAAAGSRFLRNVPSRRYMRTQGCTFRQQYWGAHEAGIYKFCCFVVGSQFEIGRTIETAHHTT